MFAIEAVNEKGWRWISAICQERRAAEAFLASVPPALRPIQRLVELGVRGYPLFVVEDRGFEYGDADFVRTRLAEAVPCGNDDAILFNVYIVHEDFIPDVPGEDSMGAIFHWHITDSSLRLPRAEVIAEELLEAERSAK